ncbi:MAG: hypothetical protein JL50_09660 [Peptococcaceae bacterium BICA1-7]|nr:MAG: hypothetical protein JL50_09660 [Peptococcaceae bacterium BICA1-7]HBV95547.1 hypothetical protein [Desulfotomaculum sp.]
MTIKLSLQQAQDIYQKSNTILREKEYLRASMQRVKDLLEVGLASGEVGEKAVRECLAELNEALGVTGDVK